MSLSAVARVSSRLPGFKGHVIPMETVKVGRVPTHTHQVHGKWAAKRVVS